MNSRILFIEYGNAAAMQVTMYGTDEPKYELRMKLVREHCLFTTMGQV